MKYKNQNGTALLLALIVMSALVVGGITIGTIVIGEIKQSRQLDRAIISYYAAESGAERLLFDWRDTRDTRLFSGSCDEGNNSQAGWSCSLKVGTLTQLSFNLPQLQVQEFPLYNPSNLSQAAGIDRATISWFDSSPGDLVEPWLEATLLEWPAGSSVDFVTDKKIIKKAFKCSPAIAGGATCESITLNDFSTGNSYILRLRALNQDVSNVTVKFFDGVSPNPMDLSNYIRIADFTGSYLGVKQGLRVRFPVVDPSASMFDWVLFSEESLLKNLF